MAYNNSTGSTHNTTILELQWSVFPICLVIVTILAVLTNGITLLTFLTNRSLWTPFNIYLINLTATNLLHALIQNPLDIINCLHRTWPLSYAACTFSNYGSWIINAAIEYSHVLITVDRIWAVISPFNYRHQRSVKTSLFMCAAIWTYIHIFVLPGVITDALYYRLPLDTHPCYLNAGALANWAMAVQFGLFDVTLFIVVGAFPVIWCVKRRRDQRVVEALELATTRVTRSGSAAHDDGNVATTKTGYQPRRPRRTTSKTVNSHGFRVLTLLTISIAILWTPAMTYYTILAFKPIEGEVVYQLVTLLFAVESVADPIWLVLSITSLRAAVLRPLKYCK